MTELLDFLRTFSRSDWISIVGIIISAIIAILLYKFSRKVSFQQKLKRQHEVQGQLDKHIGHDIEIYNARLYKKRYFYDNKKDALHGYCYLGAGVRGYGIDGVELNRIRESWNPDFKVEVVGILPYDWIEYIKEGGDGSTSKTIIFARAPWFRFPYRNTVYYRYGRKGTDKISDEYRRIRKPLTLRMIHGLQKAYYKLRYHLYLKWKMR